MSRGAGPLAFLHRSAPSTDGRPMSSGELLTSGYEWPVAGSQTIVTTFQLKHKASPAFEGDFTISDCADLLWTLMDHLQVSLSNICGFSLGGAVALEMAQVA